MRQSLSKKDRDALLQYLEKLPQPVQDKIREAMIPHLVAAWKARDDARLARFERLLSEMSRERKLALVARLETILGEGEVESPLSRK